MRQCLEILQWAVYVACLSHQPSSLTCAENFSSDVARSPKNVQSDGTAKQVSVTFWCVGKLIMYVPDGTQTDPPSCTQTLSAAWTANANMHIAV